MNKFHALPLILLILILGCAPCEKLRYKTIKCENGQLVNIPKQDRFAFYKAEKSKTIKLLSGISNYNVEISAEDSANYEQLVEKLDQITTTTIIRARMAQETFISFPCDEDSQKEYRKRMSDLDYDLNELQILRLKTKSVTTEGQISGSNLEDIIVFIKDTIEKIEDEN